MKVIKEAVHPSNSDFQKAVTEFVENSEPKNSQEQVALNEIKNIISKNYPNDTYVDDIHRGLFFRASEESIRENRPEYRDMLRRFEREVIRPFSRCRRQGGSLGVNLKKYNPKYDPDSDLDQ